MVSPGDLNQRSFPGPSIDSVMALRRFRQATGSYNSSTQPPLLFVQPHKSLSRAETQHSNYYVRNNAALLLVIIMFVIINPIKP